MPLTKSFSGQLLGNLVQCTTLGYSEVPHFFRKLSKGVSFSNSVLRTNEYGDIAFTTVGDSAFPQLPWLMKPYDESTRDSKKNVTSTNDSVQPEL